jgi:hypothetical protein
MKRKSSDRFPADCCDLYAQVAHLRYAKADPYRSVYVVPVTAIAAVPRALAVPKKTIVFDVVLLMVRVFHTLLERVEVPPWQPDVLLGS